MHQYVIFDGNTRNAKLMGVEYVVSKKLFDTLSEDEKKLWHIHVYEVASGTLIAPGRPEKAEHEFMEKMIGASGKTWHTWHTDEQHNLPVGIPHLMMGFTDDGQLAPSLVADRDRRFSISTSERRKSREKITVPPTTPGADSWKGGEVLHWKLDRIKTKGPGTEAPAKQ